MSAHSYVDTPYRRLGQLHIMYIYIYIYIYIHIEREREILKNHTHTHTYVYIYIYRERERYVYIYIVFYRPREGRCCDRRRCQPWENQPSSSTPE